MSVVWDGRRKKDKCDVSKTCVFTFWKWKYSTDLLHKDLSHVFSPTKNLSLYLSDMKVESGLF